MLHKLTLGLVVLVLLAGCAGYALPETLSATRAEEDMPLVDQQALAEFQLEASGEVAIEPAVPAPIEDVIETDGRLIKEQLERDATKSAGSGLVRDAEPVGMDPYWQDFLPVSLEFVGESSAVEPAVPVKPEEPTWTNDDLLPDELELIDELPGMVPAPVEDRDYRNTGLAMETEEEAWPYAELARETTVPRLDKWGPTYETFLDDSMSDVGYVPPIAVAPIDDAAQYVLEERTPIDDLLDEQAMRTVPAPVEDFVPSHYEDYHFFTDLDGIEPDVPDLRPALPTEGIWGPSYEDGFSFSSDKPFTDEAEVPARFRDLPTGGTWGPSYEEGLAVPVRPAPTDEAWIEDGGVIIGYGPTDFKMPVIDEPAIAPIAPSDEAWVEEAGVIIDYDPSAFEMPTPKKPIGYSEIPESLKGPFFYGHPFYGHPALEEFRYRVEDEPLLAAPFEGKWGPDYADEFDGFETPKLDDDPAAPVQPIRIPDTLEQTNPIYYEWLMENK